MWYKIAENKTSTEALYLYKEAKKKQHSQEERDKTLKRYGRAGAAAQLAGLGAGVAAVPFISGHMESDAPITMQRAREMVPDLAGKFDGSFKFNQRGGPAFFPSLNKVNAGKGINEAILAHELGHATMSPTARKVINNVYLGSKKVRQGAGISNLYNLARMAGDHLGIVDDSKTKDERLRNIEIGTGISALTHAPSLIEETRANYHALRSGAKRGKLKQYVKSLAPGYGSYLATAAVPTIGYLGLRKYRKMGEEGKKGK